MSKLDKTKTIIELLKNVLMAFLFALFGIVSYTFINIGKLGNGEIFFIAIALLLNVIIISVLVRFIVRKINELEDL